MVGARIARSISLLAPRLSAAGSVFPLGLRYMAASAFLFSVMALFVKLASATVPTMQIVFVRSLVMVAMTLVLLRRENVSPWGVRKGLLMARAASGMTGLSLLYFALSRIPLGDATAIFYMSPIWTALTAALILRERTAGLVIAGMAVSLAGVVLTAKPSFLFGESLGALEGLAVLGVLAASLGSGLAYTLVRKLRETDHPLVIIFYLSWVGVVGALPFASNWVWPTGWTWVWLLGAGLATQIAQIAMTRGLHLESAGRATTVGYLQVAFAFGWGVLVFGTVPDTLSIVGAVLICASVLLIAKR
ncbi:MAG: DMT family transporter [Rubricoccaceae bacterium]